MREIRVRIERLAPTGEGVAHDGGKVVFVDGALPGEEVDAVVFEERKRHARAGATAVREESPDRRAAGPHGSVCGGTDWAHVELDAARRFKRDLFLETMQRLGGIAADEFGDLPIAPSGLAYRLRNQFHVERGPDGSRLGFFARRSHRVVPLDACEIVSPDTREKMQDALRRGDLPVTGRIEAVESVGLGAGHRLALRGEGGAALAALPSAVDILVGDRPFRVSTASFFQVNRHRVAPFFDRIRNLAASSGFRTALDACSGVGYLSQALAEAGASVVAVESSPHAAADARVNRESLGMEGRIELRREAIETFVRRGSEPFDIIAADPPRGGLKSLARPLGDLARDRFLYVSCEPASLARDLRDLRAGGFTIAQSWLEDFFPLTHRVEAVVELVRR